MIVVLVVAVVLLLAASTTTNAFVPMVPITGTRTTIIPRDHCHYHQSSSPSSSSALLMADTPDQQPPKKRTRKAAPTGTATAAKKTGVKKSISKEDPMVVVPVAQEKKMQDATPPPAPKVMLETLRKGDLVSYVAEKSGMSKKASEDFLAIVLEGIQDGVKDGKKVSLAGFGVFQPKQRAARKGRNPQTGEEIQIAASISPGFTPAKAWKDSLNKQ